MKPQSIGLLMSLSIYSSGGFLTPSLTASFSYSALVVSGAGTLTLATRRVFAAQPTSWVVRQTAATRNLAAMISPDTASSEPIVQPSSCFISSTGSEMTGGATSGCVVTPDDVSAEWSVVSAGRSILPVDGNADGIYVSSGAVVSGVLSSVCIISGTGIRTRDGRS